MTFMTFRRILWPVVVASAGACGGGAKESMPPRYLGATQHEQEAMRQDREADQHEAAYESQRRAEATRSPAAQCADQPLWVPDPTSGGERLPVLRPCWTSDQRSSQDQLREAAEHRREAARHIEAAAALRKAERESCASLGKDELSHSPFYHRADILEVESVMAKGQVEGARVVFRRVPGLDAAWMRKAISCHQARAAALGYPPTIMSYCPLMIAPTGATVEETADTVTVTVRASRDEQAAAVLARAQDLVDRRAPR